MKTLFLILLSSSASHVLVPSPICRSNEGVDIVGGKENASLPSEIVTQCNGISRTSLKGGGAN
jgi:hypothetical protein